MNAKTEADLERAGDHLAEAITTVGIDTAAAFLTKGIVKGAKPPQAGTVRVVEMSNGTRVPVWVRGESKIVGGNVMEARRITDLYPGLRLPSANGKWVGEPGNSGWVSNLPQVKKLTKGEPVPYTNGFIRLEKWALAKVKITQTGDNNVDFAEANKLFAKQKGWLKADGTPNAAEAERYLIKNDLTWHHVEDRQTMLLVPRALNRIPHTGGAAMSR